MQTNVNNSAILESEMSLWKHYKMCFNDLQGDCWERRRERWPSITKPRVFYWNVHLSWPPSLMHKIHNSYSCFVTLICFWWTFAQTPWWCHFSWVGGFTNTVLQGLTHEGPVHLVRHHHGCRKDHAEDLAPVLTHIVYISHLQGTLNSSTPSEWRPITLTSGLGESKRQG